MTQLMPGPLAAPLDCCCCCLLCQHLGLMPHSLLLLLLL
jgi:hypothetical protein